MPAPTWRTKAAFLVQKGDAYVWTWKVWEHMHGNKHAAILEKAVELRAARWDFGTADHDMSGRANF
jgi:hypothetical protein